MSKIEQYKNYFYNKSIKLTTNSYPSHIYHSTGHYRQQLIMFEADLYTDPNVEYIGFVDTDCLFITYTDREDLFEGSKPVINGRIGNNQNSWWLSVPLSTYWLFGSKPEPMRCMSYFPVIIKRTHLVEMRQHLLELHQLNDFHKLFQDYSAKNTHFSQFNAMCAYLWYYKRDEYVWYVHDTNPGQPSDNSTVSDKSTFNQSMFEPKPRIAIHTRYHSRKNFNDIIVEGFCRSPPFPKNNASLEVICKNYNLEDVFNELHSFEQAEWWSIVSEDKLQNANKARLDRIKKCNFTHTYMLNSLEALLK